MQSLGPDQYARLRHLASAWEQERAAELAAASQANPHLGVDALCFQHFTPAPPDEPSVTYLAGALVTPVSLSLVLVPAESDGPAPTPGAYRPFLFPSGRYPFIAERLSEGTWLWRCELLDDLSDLASPEEASRLAQRLMDRVMAPEA